MMGIFRNRENYDNYERENFDRGGYDRDNYDRNADNNFDRMYDSREYSGNNSSRRFDDRSGGYNRSNYAEEYRYPSDDRAAYEQSQRPYRERYPRYDERPAQNEGYYPSNGSDSARQSNMRDGENKVVFCTPKSYEDIQNLIDSLKKKQSLIVDVSDLDVKNTQRYLDFLSGAIYALNGSYQKIDNKKFYFAPQGVSITIPFDLRQKKE